MQPNRTTPERSGAIFVLVSGRFLPYVETSTSRSDLSYDANGFAFMTRTFKVWDIDPAAFFTSITNIVSQSGVPLPDYGHVFASIDGPSGTVGADSTSTDLRLWKYTLHPIAANIFVAVAHYTNDPKQAPLGQDYRSSSQYAMVNIPYARRIPVNVAPSGGSAAATYLGFTEASVPIRMQVQRITQTVTVQRSLRDAAEAAARDEAGSIHNVGTIGYSKFEGMEVSLRSPQWIDIRYNWTWEKGIRDIFTGDAFQTVLTDDASGGSVNINAYSVFPQGWMQAADARLGTASRHVVFPYHTIEMSWQIVNSVRQPFWFSRLPYEVRPNGVGALVGAEKFEWNI